MGHIESKGVMLPLDVSCYFWNIMWSWTWHLWMQHNLHIHISRATTASLPYLHSCYLCSLQRVDPYPTYGVLSYLLLSTCRLPDEWIPTPYIWSFNHVSRSPVLINVPDVFSCRLQCVLRYTWNEHTHSFSKDTSNEYTRSFCRQMNRNKCNAYSHSLTTHEMYTHMFTQCFLRTGCDFVSTRVCILVGFFRWYPIHSMLGGLRQTHHASLRSTLSFRGTTSIDLHSHCVCRLTHTVPLSPSHRVVYLAHTVLLKSVLLLPSLSLAQCTRSTLFISFHTSRRDVFLCITPRSHSVFFIVVTV